MRTNAAGLALIKKFEGCKLQAYLCPAGVPTIGWGHTRDVKLGQRITQHQADVILESDLDVYEENVAELCPGTNENQFSALVSFAYNLGVTNLGSSTLRKKYLRGDLAGAAAEFGKWVKAKGQVLPGLVARRAAERALFEAPV